MKSLMRKLVAGPKKKTAYKGQQLDLTYITEKIIAMAFPASNFLQKTYRNSIDDVASYFQQHHPQSYLIINVSSRSYDYSRFQNRVLEYEWPDHQAPPVTTLIDIAHKAHQFLLKNEKGVVAVHCNHGKGRTGTAIISILLYLGLYLTVKEALTFYNSQRFSENTYGVDQPCQTRYLGFVQKVLSLSKKLPPKLIAYRLSHVSQTGLHDKHYITIKHVRTSQVLVDRFNFSFYSKIQGLPLIGDLFIEVFEQSWPTNKHIARINYNSFFIEPITDLSLEAMSKDEISVTFKGHNIKCNKSLNKDFSIKLEFQYFCLCHINKMEGECECQSYRESEEHFWKKMIKQCKQAPSSLKHHQQEWKYEEMVQKKIEKLEKKLSQEGQECHDIYLLGKNLSNIQRPEHIMGVLREGKKYKEEEEMLMDDQIGSDKQEDEQQFRKRRNINVNIGNLVHEKQKKKGTEQEK